jgi:hypothetical protein
MSSTAEKQVKSLKELQRHNRSVFSFNIATPVTVLTLLASCL